MPAQPRCWANTSCRHAAAHSACALVSHCAHSVVCCSVSSGTDAGTAGSCAVDTCVDTKSCRLGVCSRLTAMSLRPARRRPCPLTSARHTRRVPAALSAVRRSRCARAGVSAQRRGRSVGFVLPRRRWHRSVVRCVQLRRRSRRAGCASVWRLARRRARLAALIVPRELPVRFLGSSSARRHRSSPSVTSTALTFASAAASPRARLVCGSALARSSLRAHVCAVGDRRCRLCKCSVAGRLGPLARRRLRRHLWCSVLEIAALR